MIGKWWGRAWHIPMLIGPRQVKLSVGKVYFGYVFLLSHFYYVLKNYELRASDNVWTMDILSPVEFIENDRKCKLYAVFFWK